MNKTVVRTAVREKLMAMPKEDHKRKSLMIHNKLINLQEIKDAKTVAITISKFPEVNTKDLIEVLWKMGKQVAIPKCTPRTREMKFYVFTDYEQLEQVYMDLYEPIEGKTTFINKKEIDVLISPGIVFDKLGYRVGYGGGYYDRYLIDYENFTVSMGFEVQIVEKIDANEYDLPICTIITEEQIIACSDARREDINE